MISSHFIEGVFDQQYVVAKVKNSKAIVDEINAFKLVHPLNFPDLLLFDFGNSFFPSIFVGGEIEELIDKLNRLAISIEFFNVLLIKNYDLIVNESDHLKILHLARADLHALFEWPINRLLWRTQDQIFQLLILWEILNTLMNQHQ